MDENARLPGSEHRTRSQAGCRHHTYLAPSHAGRVAKADVVRAVGTVEAERILDEVRMEIARRCTGTTGPAPRRPHHRGRVDIPLEPVTPDAVSNGASARRERASARHLLPLGSYSHTLESDGVGRRERQIVQSKLNLVEFSP